MLAAEDLFARHLDLAPLRRRRRGVVRCPFHADRTPSLSVDLDRGVFYCFGCGQKGGVKAFAKLVGERMSDPTPRRPQAPAVSPLAEAREQIFHDARRQPGMQETVQRLYEASDFIRRGRRAVQHVRECHSLSDSAESWALLVRAAQLDTFVSGIEAELAEILMGAIR